MAKKPDWKYFDDIREAKIKKTLAYKNTLKYLERLTDDLSFKKKVIAIRKKVNIPLKGITRESCKDENKDTILAYLDNSGKKEACELYDNLRKDIGLNLLWTDIIHHYVVYNNFEGSDRFVDTIHIEDIFKVFNGPFQFEAEKDFLTKEYLNLMSKEHQVAIFIGPYTPLRDIVDYIKKLYISEIKPIQDLYKDPKVKKGKIRKKNIGVKDRNNFIFKNKDLNKREIVKLVQEKYGIILEYTYIAKIIKEEEKLKKLTVLK